MSLWIEVGKWFVCLSVRLVLLVSCEKDEWGKGRKETLGLLSFGGKRESSKLSKFSHRSYNCYKRVSEEMSWCHHKHKGCCPKTKMLQLELTSEG